MHATFLTLKDAWTQHNRTAVAPDHITVQMLQFDQAPQRRDRDNASSTSQTAHVAAPPTPVAAAAAPPSNPPSGKSKKKKLCEKCVKAGQTDEKISGSHHGRRCIAVDDNGKPRNREQINAFLNARKAKEAQSTEKS